VVAIVAGLGFLYLNWRKNSVGSGNVLGVAWYDEDGSDFTITTADELYEFAELSGHYDFKGQTIKLGADIVVNEGDAADWEFVLPERLWYPITGFAGIFDGQGYSIKNWSLEVTASGDNQNGAFFSYVSGTVKNVVIDSSCKVEYKTSGFTRGTSSLVGCLGNGASVLNCRSLATIHSDLCRVNSAGDVRGSSKVGGFIGRLESVSGVNIENLTFEGNITSAAGAGGIVGYIGSGVTDIEIENCVNSGSVTSENITVKGGGEAYWRCGSGGIVGLQDSAAVSSFTNCHNYGTVTNNRNSTDAYAGAIIGIICQDNTTVNINNCSNYGQLISVGGGGGCCGNSYNASKVNSNNYNDYRTLPQIEGYQKQVVAEGATSQGLRIIGSIDSLDYQDVGFNITIKDANGNPVKDNNNNDVVIENYKCKYVYTSLAGMDGDTSITYSRDTLRPNGYLFAVVIPNVPASLGTITVEVSTFCVTTAGNTVAGESYTFTYTVGTN
jgi:hypothetical protein